MNSNCTGANQIEEVTPSAFMMRRMSQNGGFLGASANVFNLRSCWLL